MLLIVMISVDHYELRFANDLASLVDNYDSSQLWPTPPRTPLPAGAETTHVLDFAETPQLLDQPVFVAMRGLNGLGASGPVSNVVRLLVASPPSSSVPPSGADFDPADPSVIPRVAAPSGLILQVMLPVAAGIVVLAVCVSLYCVMVVHRRKRHSKEPPPSQSPPPQQPYSGPPPRYEAEDDYNKQRVSCFFLNWHYYIKIFLLLLLKKKLSVKQNPTFFNLIFLLKLKIIKAT